MGLNEITALYQHGFNPTSLHLNGSASLADSRLRLTDGGPNENASAYYTTPVDVTRSFSTTFDFQFSPNGSAPLGQGLTFEIQSENSISTSNTLPNLDAIGLVRGPILAIKFDTYANAPWPGFDTSDNSTGVYTNANIPAFTDTGSIVIPKSLIDLHSGHVFHVTLNYTPPTTQRTGQLSQIVTDQTTTLSWSHLYDGIDLQALFQRNDVDGRYAYAGFTASTGGPGNPFFYGAGLSTQDILSWTWTDGTENKYLPYSASFTLNNEETTAAAIFDSKGQLVRTLWQANPLPAGTYNAYWDGRDQYGSILDPAKNPGPYKFSVIESRVTYSSHVIGNNTIDPANAQASISSAGMYGVVVSHDGSKIWAATIDGDTAAGGYINQFDGSGNINVAATDNFGYQQVGEAVALDSDYIYAVAEVQSWSGEWGIFKTRLSDYDGSSGFTNYGHVNEDGSQNTNLGGWNYLSIIKNVSGYHMLPGIAVSNPADPMHGSLWVTDLANNLVHQYDKVTGDQIGSPILVPHPTGIAIDTSGNVWIAHSTTNDGNANEISIYDQNRNLIKNETNIIGLSNVWSLAIANGKLYVADKGAGQVLVYAISGASVVNGQNPQRVGSPASIGVDDGRNYFWDLRGVAADYEGNIYTVQVLKGVGASGTQLGKWSPSGESLWVKGGYEYQSVGGVSSSSDPTTVYSSSLHRYKLINSSTGAWQYTGSAVFSGYDTNKWSGLSNATPSSPPRSVRIGTADFFALPTSSGDRIIFLRINPDGSLHPSTIVGASGLSNGNAWTWNDSQGDGVPQDGQIKDSGTQPGSIGRLFADSSGNLWYQMSDAIFKIPLQGEDGRGNPVYDWTQTVRFASGPYSMQSFAVGDDGIYAAYVDLAMGPQSSYSVYANYSVGGANALCKYDFSGKVLWRIPLPAYCSTMDVIPGGGVIMGSLMTSVLYNVTASGQVIGFSTPLAAGDWLDFSGAMVVSRNSRDGILDVFTEGIGFSDTPWYRIDDRTPNLVLQATAVERVIVALTSSRPVIAPIADTVVDEMKTLAFTATVASPDQPANWLFFSLAAGAPAGAMINSSTGAFTWTPTEAQGPGDYAIRVIVTDNGTPSASDSQAFHIHVSEVNPPTAPSSLILLAADDSGTLDDSITKVKMPRLTGTAEPGSTVQLVGPGGLLGTAVVGASGAFTVQSAMPFADGIVALQARAVDVAGVVGSLGPVLLLKIDTIRPVRPAAATLLTNDDTGIAGDGITTVRIPHLVGTAEAGSTVELVGPGGMLGSALAGPSGSYSIVPTSVLPIGANSLSVTAVDVAGNASTASPAFVLTITSPTLAPSSPHIAAVDDSGTLGDGITNVNRPHFVGMASPNIIVEIVNGTGAILGMATSAVDGSYSIVLPLSLSDGTFTVSAMATGLDGTSLSSSGVSITIDTVAPLAPSSIRLVAADDSGTLDDSITKVKMPRLTGTAEPGSTVQLVGPGGLLGTAVVGASGAFTVQSAMPFADGSYTLVARALDTVGNVSQSTPVFKLTILTTRPVTPSAPTLLVADDSGVVGDGTTRVATPRLTGSIAIGTSVRLLGPLGVLLGQATATGTALYTVAPSLPLSDGPTSLSVVAVDPAGNVSLPSLALSLTLLTKAPVTPSVLTIQATDDSGTLGDGITNVTQPRFSGKAGPFLSIALFDAGGRPLGQSTSGADGTFLIKPSLPLSSATIGVHAMATDVAGNTSLDSPPTTLTILTTLPAAPGLALLAVDDSGIKGDGITNVRRPRLSGFTSRGNLVQVLDPAGAVVASTVVSNIDGSFLLTIPANSAGTFTYRARVTDVAGNVSTLRAVQPIRILAISGDFDGDSKADLVNYDPSTALWSIRSSITGLISTTSCGWTGLDVPVAADYEGTGKSNIAVYRPVTSEWFILRSGGAGALYYQFGQAGDIPIPGDYDGIGQAELAVYRPSTAQWIILNTKTNVIRTFAFGWTGLDQPVPADYDGAGRLQIAVCRPGLTLNWFILHVNGTVTESMFGPGGDLPIPADYDGDGKADIAVYDPSTALWFDLQSTNGMTIATQCGWVGVDQPVPADYDGDGKVDYANYRSPNASFYVRSSLDASRIVQTVGNVSSSQASMTPLAFRLRRVSLLPVNQNVFLPPTPPFVSARLLTSILPLPELLKVAVTKIVPLGPIFRGHVVF